MIDLRNSGRPFHLARNGSQLQMATISLVSQACQPNDTKTYFSSKKGFQFQEKTQTEALANGDKSDAQAKEAEADWAGRLLQPGRPPGRLACRPGGRAAGRPAQEALQ